MVHTNLYTEPLWRVRKVGEGLVWYTRFSLEIYFQMVHNTIGRYETPSQHTAIEMLSGKAKIVTAMGRV